MIVLALLLGMVGHSTIGVAASATGTVENETPVTSERLRHLLRARTALTAAGVDPMPGFPIGRTPGYDATLWTARHHAVLAKHGFTPRRYYDEMLVVVGRCTPFGADRETKADCRRNQRLVSQLLDAG